MGLNFQTALGVIGAVAISFLARDLYACSPRLQRILLRLATRMLPQENREDAFKQWYGDLMAMAPSELLRTLYAVDCLRGGLSLGWRSRKLSQENDNVVGSSETSSSDWDALLASMTKQNLFYEGYKRVTDFLVAALYLIAVIPLLVLIGVAIKLESEGPILYRQLRIGRGGKPFGVYKFRSIKVPNASTIDIVQTRVGQFLRRTLLDEIPQVINVLTGDMSFVGPRPERPYIAKALGEVVPHYDLRLTVRPGITGWAQVRNRNEHGTLDEVKGRIYDDVYYTKHRSFWMDLKIMFKTVRMVMFHPPSAD
jgi:lipopolysaccharide/colanic/teichoic acid biosynthesis glycosyltransferase